MEEKFNECFKSKGGILKHKNEKTKCILNAGNALVNHIKNIYPKLPNIYIDFIDNNSINASAKKFEGGFFIGINIGTMNLIEDLFLKIQSCKSHKSEECPKLNLINSGNGLEYISPLDTLIMPFSKENFLKAKKQTQIAFKFIIYHEICHILRGHLGFLNENHNLYTNEINEISNPISINILQTLEMDADSFSTNRIINDYLEGRIINQESKDPESEGFKTYMCNYSYSVYCFFRVFGFHNLDISKIKSKAHPTPAFRISLILDNISTVLIARNITNPHILSDVIKSISEAEKDLHEVTYFNNQIERVKEIYSNENFIEYKHKITSNWKEIKLGLEKHTFGSLPK